jgi:hypothetical protein
MGKDETVHIKRQSIDWEKLKEYNPDDIRIRYHEYSGKIELILENEADR